MSKRKIATDTDDLNSYSMDAMIPGFSLSE